MSKTFVNTKSLKNILATQANYFPLKQKYFVDVDKIF
jgi:hypothetical protein